MLMFISLGYFVIVNVRRTNSQHCGETRYFMDKTFKVFKRFSISSCDLYLHSEFFSSFKFNLLIL